MSARWLWAGVAAGLAACGPSPPQQLGEQLGEQLERIASATRTTELTARQWGDGSLPDGYAIQMSRIAGQSLRRIARRPIWQHAPADIRDTALDHAAASAALADRLGQAARSGDRAAATGLASRSARLAAATRRLRERVSPR
ncbi:MAG TPA: hypothetical protein VFS40_01025 [Gemmatimonadales bacterium]|nr:hypothetical protein [Gemmatimonadales bacterium]